jgi:hypothetical protein
MDDEITENLLKSQRQKEVAFFRIFRNLTGIPNRQAAEKPLWLEEPPGKLTDLHGMLHFHPRFPRRSASVRGERCLLFCSANRCQQLGTAPLP